MTELQDLYRLQKLELQLCALQEKLKNLPVYAVFNQAKAEAMQAKEVVAELQAKFNAQRKQIRKLELNLQQAEAEEQDLQKELFGNNKAAREVQQLEKKAKILRQNRMQQEEDLISSMEMAEELEKALEQARQKYKRLRSDLQVVQKQGNTEIRQIKVKIKKLQSEIQQLERVISKELKTEYQKIRPKFKGEPLAEVKNGICSGCYVAIPVSINSRLLTQQKIYCENCGRLLVFFPDTGDN
ncbi:MAG: hypothetical protein GX357_03455 [Firmicutes bacterium]|nr:hypothetical protein [Bacillota bacterium]